MKSYTVKAGDRITRIAERFGITPNAVLDANPRLTAELGTKRQMSLENLPTIFPGEVLQIPEPARRPEPHAHADVKRETAREPSGAGHMLAWLIGIALLGGVAYMTLSRS